MPQTLDYELFAALAGQTFLIQFTDRAVELRLTDVKALPPLRTVSKTGEPVPVKNAQRRQPFSMFFHGPADARLDQGTYRMTVESVPEPIDIFIVPVAGGRGGYTYQAIFS